jgi:hypothetical protein
MVALSAIAGFALNMAMSERNLVFTNVFRGRFDAPEVVVCGAIGLIGVVAAGFVAWRELRVEVKQ